MAETPVQRKRWDKKGEIDKERINYTSFWSEIRERNEEGRRRNILGQAKSHILLKTRKREVKWKQMKVPVWARC